MVTLQDKMLEVEKEEEKLFKDYPNFKLFKAIFTTINNYGVFIIIGLLLIADLIFYFHYHKSFNFSIFVVLVMASYIPGFIVLFLIIAILYIPVSYLSRFLFKINGVKYESILKEYGALQEKKSKLKAEIKKETEESFLGRLSDLYVKVSTKKIPYEIAITIKTRLEEENKIISKNGYQLRTANFYDDNFKKISENLNNYQKKQDQTQDLITVNPPSNIGHTTQAIPKIEPPTKTQETSKIDSAFKPRNKPIRKPVKIDFEKLNKARQEIGRLGEDYIFNTLIEDFTQRGLTHLSSKITHVSKENDSAGYDIISFTDDGRALYIEVKTTTGRDFEPFYLSSSEMNTLRAMKGYYIYRVFNFDIEAKEGEYFIINCPTELDRHYDIDAINFKVTPK